MLSIKEMSRLAIKFLGMRRIENTCVWYNEIYYREKYQTTNVSEWYICALKLPSYVVKPALVHSFSEIRLIFLF